MQYPFPSSSAIVYSIRDIKKGYMQREHARRSTERGVSRQTVRLLTRARRPLEVEAGEEMCETHIVKSQQRNVNGQGVERKDENGLVCRVKKAARNVKYWEEMT